MPTIPFHLVVRLHTAGLNNLASEEPILVIIAPLPPKRIALIARLKFKFPVSTTRNGFIIGVFLDVPALPPSTVVSPLRPGRSPASPRPSPPPSLRFACSWLVEFGSFAFLRPGESFKFCPLLEKMAECTVSKKEASSCHTSNTKLKEFDMTRMTNF